MYKRKLCAKSLKNTKTVFSVTIHKVSRQIKNLYYSSVKKCGVNFTVEMKKKRLSESIVGLINSDSKFHKI